MSRFIYHKPEQCPCRKKHRASDPPGKNASRSQKESWRSDVCDACGTSLMLPNLQSGCAFCLPEGLVQE